jgi:hypothetical protein
MKTIRQKHRHTNTYLVGLHQDEDVVDADGEDEERDDLNDDEGGGLAHKAEETERGGHGQQNDQHSTQTHDDLGVEQ